MCGARARVLLLLAEFLCLALSCALYALSRATTTTTTTTRRRRQQQHYLHKGSSQLGLAWPSPGNCSVNFPRNHNKNNKTKKYYLYYTKMSSENKKTKKRKAESQKKAINLRHKGSSSSRREGEGSGGREGADCVGKSAYTLPGCPANPITYLDFMVIPTKSGSCRCSKRKRGRRGNLPPPALCSALCCLPFYSLP